MKKETIIRFLNKSANPEETRQVLAWLEQPDARKSLDEILKAGWDASTPNEEDRTDYKEILQRIHSRTSGTKSDFQSNTNIIPWSKVFRVAASFILLVASLFFLKKGFEFNEPRPVLAEKTIQRKTGVGEKLTIKLPDGSTILLNANSSISFSSNFGKINRIVELNGEGFFQIAKDSLKPFQVKTEEMITTALGTEFNTFARNGIYWVALTEGKVAVEAIDQRTELNPGQIMILDPQASQAKIKVKSFNSNEVVGWKEGLLTFKRVHLGTILNDLAKWYGVRILIQDGFNVNRKVIGTFRNKNLSDVLTGLGFSMGFDFSINKNEVKINKSSQ